MTTRNVEDYLEVIWNLQNRKGYIKVKDIADKLEVTRPSVSEMIKKLAENNYILYEKYGGIALNAKGKKLAQEIKRRHNLLAEFLRVIGVSEKNAQEDACKLEHDVSGETVDCLLEFIEFTRLLPDNSKWIEHSREYLKKKGMSQSKSK